MRRLHQDEVDASLRRVAILDGMSQEQRALVGAIEVEAYTRGVADRQPARWPLVLFVVAILAGPALTWAFHP